MSFESYSGSANELPDLPNGWTWKLLSELVESSRGICYGIVQPGKHDPVGIPMVNTGDVFDGHVAPAVNFKVSEELHGKFRRSTLRGGELLVTLVGANFGRVAIAPRHYVGFNCSRAVGVVPVEAEAKYVMFALRSPLTRHLMDTWANTTAQPTFNLKDLGNLPIPLPPKLERQNIAEFIGALDDRISLLRETNTTLESIAQALFKSWFVDFDPVRAKQQGNTPQGMDAATAALFPDSFEESELGEVPKGWLVGVLGDAFEINPKRTLKKGSLSPYLDMASLATSGHSVENPIQREMGSGAKFQNGDTLLARITPCLENGKSAFVDFLEDKQIGWGSTEFLVLRPKAPFPEYLGYLLCRHPAFREFAIQSMSGTSGRQRIQNDVLGRYQLALPSAGVAAAFAEIVEPLQKSITANHKTAQTLATLRDTLLPRLISGQLRLPV